MRGYRVDLVLLICNDLAELHPVKEVAIGHRILGQNRVGPHVLDISFDERRALFDCRDNRMLSHNGPIDQGTLAGSELAHSNWIVLLLLPPKMRETRCRSCERCGRDEGKGETYGGVLPRNHC